MFSNGKKSNFFLLNPTEVALTIKSKFFKAHNIFFFWFSTLLQRMPGQSKSKQDFTGVKGMEEINHLQRISI